MKKITFLLFAFLVMAQSCKKTEPIIAIPMDPNDTIPNPGPHAPPFLYADGGRILTGPVETIPCDPNRVCLIFPENHASDIARNTGFVWHRFGNITQYEFQVSPFADFPTAYNIVHGYCDYEITNDTSCIPLRYNGGFDYCLISNRIYYWRVRGIAAPGDTTMWSEVHEFRVHDLRDELSGDYDVAEISWDYNYPWPYQEDSTGHFYTARISKVGETSILVEILGKGLSWEMVRTTDLSYRQDIQNWHYAYGGFFINAVGPNFIPGSEIRIINANRGNNPGYHYGGERYQGLRH